VRVCCITDVQWPTTMTTLALTHLVTNSELPNIYVFRNRYQGGSYFELFTYKITHLTVHLS